MEPGAHSRYFSLRSVVFPSIRFLIEMFSIPLLCLVILASNSFESCASSRNYAIPFASAIINPFAPQSALRSASDLSSYFNSAQEYSQYQPLLPNPEMISRIRTPVQRDSDLTPSALSSPMPSAPPSRFSYSKKVKRPARILSQADRLCKNQPADTVFPFDDGRKYTICQDGGRGIELECSNGLFYQVEKRRCDYKLSDLDNPCLTKPCLNGGECIADGASYQCRCTLGYDGEKCDLDARVCQTQFPCGQGLGVHCQSFSFGASLNYVCIFENGRAYGPTPQRTYQNPCQGTHTPQPLAFTDEGFILCNGDRMFVESCPLGTVWNDAMKACGWEDESAEETEVPIEKPQEPKVAPYNSWNSQNTAQNPVPQVETRRAGPGVFEIPTLELNAMKSGERVTAPTQRFSDRIQNVIFQSPRFLPDSFPSKTRSSYY